MSFDKIHNESFYIPKKLISNIEGLEVLFDLKKRILTSNKVKIEIRFENLEFIDTTLCSVLGAIFEEIEKYKTIFYTGLFEAAKKNSILIRNSFIARLIDKNYKYSNTKKDKEIPYKKFSTYESEKYNNYIKEQVLEKPNFPSHSRKLGDKIKENIFEIFENARTHGRCSFIHTCGQFKNETLSIAIVDSGVSIVQNVKNHLKKEDISSADCIEWAMIKGNTTKSGDIPGGLGLDIIFQFINLNRGRAQIISSNGYWELKSAKIPIKKDLNSGFDGTIAILEFNLKDENTYQLTSEQQQFNNIF